MPYNIELPNGTLLRDIPDDVSRDTINKQILQAFPDIAAKTKRSWGEAATDIGGSLLSGVGSLAQLPGQISDLAGLTTPEKTPTGLQGLGSELEQYGFNRYGYERMISGITGEYIDTLVFHGPTFYQRLQKFVADAEYSVRHALTCYNISTIRGTW